MPNTKLRDAWSKTLYKSYGTHSVKIKGKVINQTTLQHKHYACQRWQLSVISGLNLYTIVAKTGFCFYQKHTKCSNI